MSRAFRGAVVALALLVGVAYANHFDNGFHFDDSHAVVQNPFLRTLAYVPLYFVDATTFSILPTNQSYRPVLQTTLAFDYWMAGGYTARVFHVQSFLWFALQLALMYALGLGLLRAAAPGDDRVRWAALLAVALYGLHPASAETVNYIIQRGDLLSTLGVVAGVAMWAWWPDTRRRHLYLLPPVLGLLAKPPAVVFPALLFAWVLVTEALPRVESAEGAAPTTAKGKTRRKSVPPPAEATSATPGPAPAIQEALVAIGPSVLVVGAAVLWIRAHEVPTFVTGAPSAVNYWITQPWVALRYFVAFFAPIDLSADNDWPIYTRFTDWHVCAGVAFLGALAVTIALSMRRREWRPVAFGLWWFVVAMLPTSLIPLAEVANDHRMFFPFVGLSLAVAWTAWRVWLRVPVFPHRAVVTAVAVAGLLVACTAGVRARNAVWRSDGSLWYDVTVKSPRNGRGLMNYGLTRMEVGDYATAIAYFERALPLTPDYSLLHINLGIAYGGAGRSADAERQFGQAIRLAPDDWRSHMYFGRWLMKVGRLGEALGQLILARKQNVADLDTANLLAEAQTTMRRMVGGARTPVDFLNLSLVYYQAGLYRECIAAAEQALALRPDYAEALNNIGAAHNGLQEWGDAIPPLRRALALKPEFAVARNNLAQAEAGLRAATSR